jgi:hypothetical protein
LSAGTDRERCGGDRRTIELVEQRCSQAAVDQHGGDGPQKLAFNPLIGPAHSPESVVEVLAGRG